MEDRSHWSPSLRSINEVTNYETSSLETNLSDKLSSFPANKFHELPAAELMAAVSPLLDSALLEHERELAAVAQRQDVLLSAPHRVGKTFLSAYTLRAHLLATPPPTATKANHRFVAVAVAPSATERAALRRELTRLCALPVLACDAADEPLTTTVTPPNDDTKRWESDSQWVTHQLERSRVRHGRVVLVLPPAVLLGLLRKRVLPAEALVALAVESTEEVAMDAPAFFRVLLSHVDSVGAPDVRPQIFATTRAPASRLDLSSGSSNALYARIRVLNVVPVGLTQRPQSQSQPQPLVAPPLSFPPLLCEPFDASTVATTATPTIGVGDMRAFLGGDNVKQIDFVRVFRMELEMGNSAAVYDERKRQDKVNQFVQDAESVYRHLGYWCLLKFIELELQANLQACLVDDADNVNHRKRRQQLQETPELEEGEAGTADSDTEAADEPMPSSPSLNEPPPPAAADDLAALVAAQMDLDAASQQKVQPILKLLSWLHAQTTKPALATAVTPRLRQTAQVVYTQLRNDSGASKRVWVFLERRAHCRVVADYLTAFVADLELPPCCCMLGNSNARVSGSLHFSSYLKVMTMFTTGEANVLVTTSIASKSQKQRVEPPTCDLVVVMDELLEANKLFEFGKRASPATGVVKYVTPNTPGDLKKFTSLVAKMREFIQLEEEQSSAQAIDRASSHPPGATMASDVTDLLTKERTLRDAAGRIQVVPRVVNVVNQFEIVNHDTGAILNAANAVACLSAFCDSLPGLDTYDKRPQYIVKRHPLAVGLSAATKAHRKKRLKYNAKIHDKIDDCRADAEAAQQQLLVADGDDGPDDAESAFEFSATLKIPLALGIKRKLVSHKVPTADEAKGIAAFKACQELVKRGLLDRSFRSKLIDDQTATIHRDTNGGYKRDKDTVTVVDGPLDDTIIIDADDDAVGTGPSGKLKDLSTQNSYDLPPVSAAELSLRPIRTILNETTTSNCTSGDGDGDGDGDEAGSVAMCFYGLTGVRYAILTTNELYTGTTNTGWRYDFATSDVMEPTIRPVTLAKSAVHVRLTKAELQDALHFHLTIMRLACMGVDDAMRDVDIASDDVWKEFSELNDKGYLVVPSVVVADPTTANTLAIDWAYVKDILGKPLIQPIWPLPDLTASPLEEWICVPTHRRNVTYVVQELSTQTAREMKVAFADKETWAKHTKEGKSSKGKPILGRWHTSEQIQQADDDQPLIYGVQVPPIVPIIRRVIQRNNAEGSIATVRTKFNERLLLPECTSLLRLTKTRYFEAIGIVPILYEFERKCQMSHLMGKIGLELDITLLDDATSKPAYERLEILGDTFLKLETTWFMYEHRQDIAQEGELTRLRRDIIRNDRLNEFALARQLHHYIVDPARIEQHPFEYWKPSCMGRTPKAVVAPAKWIADVLEAVCGAYLLGHGEKGGRYFLQWIGVSVLEAPFMFARPFYPDCFPCELYDDDFGASGTGTGALSALAPNFSVARFEDLPQRLVWLQQRLKYTFTNKRLLLEAVTHPSAGHLELQTTTTAGSTQKTFWKGDYERLEYLGDAIIEYLTLSYAFLRYDTWLPGSLTQWKSATVSNDALGKTALACFGVDECICAGAVRMDRETLGVVARIERKYPRDTGGEQSTTDSRNNYMEVSASASRKRVKATGTNPMSLPKMFADVFEALVAAVFLDSGKDLQTTRDVFLGPLLDTVGRDALAYVCHESGLTIEQFDADAGAADQDEIMESLFSDDEDD